MCVASAVTACWVAYLLLGTARFVDEARSFVEAVTRGLAPALWEAELANVIWMAVRQGVLPAADAPRRRAWAGTLGIESVSIRTLWHGALVRGVTSGVAVYDTLFVELAAREKLSLATFDRNVLEAFPDIASRPGDLLTHKVQAT